MSFPFRFHHRPGPALCLLAVLGLVYSLAAQAQSEAQEAIRARVEQLLFTDAVRVAGVPINAKDLVVEFYTRRDFTPAWVRDQQLDALSELADTAIRFGLRAVDYPIARVDGLRVAARHGGSPAERADLDILATETLIRIGYHLRFGKVNPQRLDPSWNFQRRIKPGVDPVDTLSAIIESESMVEQVTALSGPGVIYQRLVEELARYRAIEAAGGWPDVPAGETLKPDAVDPRVVAIRARLTVTGDLDGGSVAEPERYDAPLEAAVKRFQARHGLEPDGVIGKQSYEALNLPVSVKIDKLRASLERARWVSHGAQEDRHFVLVNIAGFQLHLIRDMEPVWNARIQVGRPYRQTPVFRGEMEYLVFNPTWTVPPTILAKDVLPRLKKDPGYLSAQNMEVLDRDGRPVNAASIDWASASPRGFPYMLRQRPGPENALGRVKFIFPNSHLVFLHDTPSQSLFDRADRTFSSGCIRVENALDLAEILLADTGEWNRKAVDDVLESGKIRTVHLKQRLPVYLLYWTADVDDSGTAHFYRDVYDRDRKLLDALDGEIVIDLPDAARADIGTGANPWGPEVRAGVGS
jgi:murein L,D-transpeptidase YcbB/YkuD